MGGIVWQFSLMMSWTEEKSSFFCVCDRECVQLVFLSVCHVTLMHDSVRHSRPQVCSALDLCTFGSVVMRLWLHLWCVSVSECMCQGDVPAFTLCQRKGSFWLQWGGHQKTSCHQSWPHSQVRTYAKTHTILLLSASSIWIPAFSLKTFFDFLLPFESRQFFSNTF